MKNMAITNYLILSQLYAVLPDIIPTIGAGRIASSICDIDRRERDAKMNKSLFKPSFSAIFRRNPDKAVGLTKSLWTTRYEYCSCQQSAHHCNQLVSQTRDEIFDKRIYNTYLKQNMINFWYISKQQSPAFLATHDLKAVK
uniref:Uncharacterized protein n=1 Tax=Onchocerca volvulus TaxID=6282 RepID=A0A8R1TUW9_ONCVO